MVFHSSAKFLMNRFLWVNAKICVLLWTRRSFSVVYLNAALASVERRNLKCMSGYLWLGNDVYKDMIRNIRQSNFCWLTSGKMHCRSNYSMCLGFWCKGGCSGGFSEAVRLFILQSGWFCLVLIHVRKVIIRKTNKNQHSSFPFPFPKQPSVCGKYHVNVLN